MRSSMKVRNQMRPLLIVFVAHHLDVDFREAGGNVEPGGGEGAFGDGGPSTTRNCVRFAQDDREKYSGDTAAVELHIPMHIKKVQAEDVDALVTMMRAMQGDDPWSVEFDAERARKSVELMLSNPYFGTAWLIEDAGRVVGYIVLSWDFSLEYGGRNAWVDEFYIERAARGKGLGARVLAEFEREAKAAGATAVHLEVNEGNRAIELYRRAGYEDHRRYLMTKWL